MNKYLTKESLDPTASIAVPHPQLAGYANLEWKLAVGAECNRLLAFAEAWSKKLASCSIPSSVNSQHVADIRSLVARVANFEELETE